MLRSYFIAENKKLLKIFNKLFNITNCTSKYIEEILRLKETIKLEMITNLK